jgi:glutamine amidotransferase
VGLVSAVSQIVGVIDHGVGNVVAIINLLSKIGVKTVKITNAKQIQILEEKDLKLVIPGVGSFDTGMKSLTSAGLDLSIKSFASGGGHVLGICLGMQLLFDESEEGVLKGLGLVSGSLIKMTGNKKFKVPHVGWEPIVETRSDLIFEDISRMAFYHNHSYAVLSPSKYEIAKMSYLCDYTVAVRNKNVIGVQFHPEKSHSAGERLMRNFLNS